MKKIIYTILILCFSCYFSFSENNYIDYHRKCNQAKLLISNRRFSDALDVYQKVFQEYDKAFYRDIHNACVCAIKCNAWIKAKKYAKELVLHGYTLKDFNRLAFNELRNSCVWKEFKQSYPELRKKYEANLDLYLSKKYYFMCREDQKIAWMSPFGDSVSDQARLELSSLLKLDYEQNGMPVFMRFKDPLYLKYYIMYRHYFGRKNYLKNHPEIPDRDKILKKFNDLNLQQVLKEEIRKGNVSPKTLVDASTYNANPYGKEYIVNIDFEKEKVFFSLDPSMEKVEQINKNRLTLGMLTLEDEFAMQLRGSWYSDYPFKQIKKSIKELNLIDRKQIMKLLIEQEAKTRKKITNNRNKIFFINWNESEKKVKYIGL